ncbi:uncharacterized protein LOC135119612 [Zophobas morio]|uniref:uncharacterized protein LOC135119612 n=1 Tax=Zophobas morio TaxID=2755281 RepID=UPI003082B441
MATCDPLQPVVLLTDVMDSGMSETDTGVPRNAEEPNPNSQLFQVEQTEPLNLCLNGSVLNDFVMVECSPKLKENGNLSAHSDDDVIFVKEYKVNHEKQQRRSNGQKVGGKGEPRRNPVRKARDTKRFKEYTDGDFYDEEFLDESADEENSVEMQEKFVPKSEDSEDWKVESIPKKTRQRRKIISRKLSHKLGRKRKFNKIKEEEKRVTLEELESLVQSNLILIRDYINDVKTVKSIMKKENAENLETFEDVTKHAIDVFKQQVILLTVVKEIDTSDLTEHIREWIIP